MIEEAVIQHVIIPTTLDTLTPYIVVAFGAAGLWLAGKAGDILTPRR